MPVKNQRSNVQCDRAFYTRLDTLTVIMCNKEYRLVCGHAKYCSNCGHYILKNSAMMCPFNRKGNNIEPKTPIKDCKCGGNK